MRRVNAVRVAVLLAFMLGAPAALAEGRLGVTDAWIRAAPKDEQTLRGYVTLTNTGDAPISVLTVQSDSFRQSSILDTVEERGVAKLRELPRVDLAPGVTIRLMPGGPHLMLSYPREPILVGDKIGVVFLLADGRRVQTYFDVVAPGKSDPD